MILLTSVKEIADEVEKAIEASDGYDYISIIQYTGDFNKVIGIVYGIVSTLIMILVPIIITIEICYICFPIMREPVEKLTIKLESSGIACKVVGLTLGDAKKALNIAETKQTGRSALWEYLKIKCTSVMVVMLVITTILYASGPTVKKIWELVEGILSQMFK